MCFAQGQCGLHRGMRIPAGRAFLEHYSGLNQIERRAESAGDLIDGIMVGDECRKQAVGTIERVEICRQARLSEQGGFGPVTGGKAAMRRLYH